MVDIVCPKCGLKDCYIIGTEGEIKEERFFETHECLSCGEVFEVKAKFCDIEIIKFGR